MRNRNSHFAFVAQRVCLRPARRSCWRRVLHGRAARTFTGARDRTDGARGGPIRIELRGRGLPMGGSTRERAGRACDRGLTGQGARAAEGPLPFQEFERLLRDEEVGAPRGELATTRIGGAPRIWAARRNRPQFDRAYAHFRSVEQGAKLGPESDIGAEAFQKRRRLLGHRMRGGADRIGRNLRKTRRNTRRQRCRVGRDDRRHHGTRRAGRHPLR